MRLTKASLLIELIMNVISGIDSFRLIMVIMLSLPKTLIIMYLLLFHLIVFFLSTYHIILRLFNHFTNHLLSLFNQFYFISFDLLELFLIFLVVWCLNLKMLILSGLNTKLRIRLWDKLWRILLLKERINEFTCYIFMRG